MPGVQRVELLMKDKRFLGAGIGFASVEAFKYIFSTEGRLHMLVFEPHLFI